MHALKKELRRQLALKRTPACRKTSKFPLQQPLLPINVIANNHIWWTKNPPNICVDGTNTKTGVIQSRFTYWYIGQPSICQPCYTYSHVSPTPRGYVCKKWRTHGSLPCVSPSPESSSFPVYIYLTARVLRHSQCCASTDQPSWNMDHLENLRSLLWVRILQ